MAGGGNRRGAGTEEVRIGTGNVFAALETLKKKKKKPAKKEAPEAVKPEVVWAPAPLTSKSWADVEDEDDDDYFATTAPLRPVWETQKEDAAAGHDDDKEHSALEQEIESEDDSLDDEVDPAAEDEDEHEAEDSVPSEQAVQKAVVPVAPPKDTDRQLSKKELKKKELEELDAVLAELGISDKSNNATQYETNGKKTTGQAADGEKKEDAPAPAESKTSKKKKAKKDKSAKEAKETQDQNDVVEDAADAEPEEDGAAVDVKERIKKVASMKKKKSSKELDAAAKIAASEAAARRAKLAAAKKKEKTHYNQQPLR